MGEQVRRYLDALSEELEALGPLESAEVVIEVRSHITDALAEPDATEEAVLAEFGPPEVLAARILEERGVISAPGRVTEAPLAFRAAAIAADGALWIVALLVIVGIAGPFAYAGLSASWGGVAFWTAAAVLAAAFVWGIVRAWRRHGRGSLGMRLMGLRRVRIGSASRVVQTRDIPGAPRDSQFGPLVGVLLAGLVIYGLVWNLIQAPGHDAENAARAAVSTAGDSAGVVSEVYRSAIAQPSAADGDSQFAHAAKPAYRALISRIESGAVASYEVYGVQLDEKYAGGTLPSNGDLAVDVLVGEYRRGSESPVNWRYHVVTTWVDEGGGESQGTTAIDRVSREPE